ncbi:MAG: Arm DNA-binding domain-containing protein [Actinomycetes bacterium]
MRSYNTTAGTRWRIVVGYTDAAGKYRQRKVSGFRTKGDAQRAARDVLQERDKGSLLDPSNVTLREWVAEEYLPWVERKGRTPVTLRNYRRCFDNWVLPHIGNSAVQRLRMEDIQRMLDDLGAQGLSRGTIKLTLVLTQAALQLAVDKDVALKNVARNSLLVIPQTRKTSSREPWSVKEAKVFLASLRPDKDDVELAFFVMALTGIRRGEVAGLRWG